MHFSGQMGLQARPTHALPGYEEHRPVADGVVRVIQPGVRRSLGLDAIAACRAFG